MSKKNHVRRQRARDRKARGGGGKPETGRNLALAMREAAEWPVHRCAATTGEPMVVVVAREGPDGEVVGAGFEVGDDGVYRAEVLDGGASDLELLVDSLASGSPLEEVPVDQAASAVERALVAGRRAGRQPPPEVYALKVLFGGPARG